MKTTITRRLFVTIAFTSLLIVAPGVNLTAQTPATATSNPMISDLMWLAGDWQTAPGGRSQTDEHWTQVAGGSMMGLSRTVAGGRTYEFEYLRIEQRPEGIFYVAHPKARCPGTDFKLTRLTATEAVFENPEHDFPKRIIYRKAADGSLVATVDGGAGNKAITLTYLPINK
jgi:hypothetical protein